MQIGNLQAIAQFLCNASKSVSGTLADILSPARMVIFGTLLTTLNKPMFAMSGYVYAAFGTVATLYWVTAGASFWCQNDTGSMAVAWNHAQLLLQAVATLTSAAIAFTSPKYFL